MRIVVALLVVANLVFWAWSQGWLDGTSGGRASGQREPDRLARQVNPERMRILDPADVQAGARTSAPVPVDVPIACLQLGPFSGPQLAAAEAALRAAVPELPAERVARVSADLPGQWVIYMGRFPSPEALQEKREELRRRNLAFEEMFERADLVPGLVLGRFNSRAEAEAARARMQEQQNVQTARVISLAGDGPSAPQILRVDRVDAAMQARLSALAEPAFNGRSFETCAVRQAPAGPSSAGPAPGTTSVPRSPGP
jgi:hypothetical protein